MPIACLESAGGVSQIFFEAPSLHWSIFECVDTASSQPGELTLTLPSPEASLAVVRDAEATARDRQAAYAASCGLTPALMEELWLAAESEACSLTRAELGAALAAIGAKHNYNLPTEARPTPAQQTAFYRELRLPDLALAQACALGREAAWERFLGLYRAPLTQAAVAITGSATLGHDLADSLYAELFGLAAPAGERKSPLASYAGRGSLLGWLRATVARHHIDHHRRTYREIPLESVEGTEIDAAPNAPATPLHAELERLSHSVARTLEALEPEDRFLLAAYFLDQQTLLQIARLLHVHEATVSRKLKRLTGDLRKQLLRNLQAGGLSKRAAEEALGADPRDLEVNLRALLQSSQPQPFCDKRSQSNPPHTNEHAITGDQRAATR
jgi:RNA polymerase sigma-70 factor (ECF subfamily)